MPDEIKKNVAAAAVQAAPNEVKQEVATAAVQAVAAVDAAKLASAVNPTLARMGSREDRLRVFLCHSSSGKPTVRALYARLQSDNIRPWLDERDILAGQDWDFEIRRAIRASDVVLVCLSRGSIIRSGYFQKEIRTVLGVADEQPEGSIFLIPVRLEPLDNMPKRFRRWQWVDLFEESGYERLIRALRARANEQRNRGAVQGVPGPIKKEVAAALGDAVVKVAPERMPERIKDEAVAVAVQEPLAAGDSEQSRIEEAAARALQNELRPPLVNYEGQIGIDVVDEDGHVLEIGQDRLIVGLEPDSSYSLNIRLGTDAGGSVSLPLTVRKGIEANQVEFEVILESDDPRLRRHRTVVVEAPRGSVGVPLKGNGKVRTELWLLVAQRGRVIQSVGLTVSPYRPDESPE